MRMQTTWGAMTIDRAVDAPSTIKVGASDMEIDGFIDDTFSEYRQRSVVRRAPGGSLSFTAPDCGPRYLGFVIFDSVYSEEVEVWIDGVKQGTAVVNGNIQRERLFTLAEPYDFRGGEQVRLVTSKKSDDEHDPTLRGPVREMTPYYSQWEKGGESYRIECAALFAELPPENELPCEFAHVHAEPIFADDDNDDNGIDTSSLSARLTWVTSWDACCRVEYWVQGTNDNTVIEEASPGANHRVILSDLAPGTTYSYRVSASDRNGTCVETSVYSFETSRPIPAAGKAVSERITLTVRNPADVGCHSSPVRSGVPFPEGVLGSSRTVRLLDPSGDEIPLQTRTLGRWPDGTVKWALVDFQADVPASSEAEYTLEYGVAVSRGTCETPLRVSEDTNGVTVDTGRLRIRWDRAEFGPFSEITRGGERYIDGSEVVVTGTDGREYGSTNAKAEAIEIEERGPIHCIVRVVGSQVSEDGATLLRSVFRVHAYVGAGYVRVDHTFENDNSETPFTDIASMYLRIGTDGGAGETHEIIQTHDDRSVVNGRVGDARLRGYGRAGDVEVEIADFWQQYPKSLRTSADGIEIGLCPSIGEKDYRVDEEEEYKLYFYLRDGVYRFREGMSKTHTIYVGEGVGDGVSSLMAQASVEWNSASGAFGEITPGTNGRFPEYEEKAVQVFGEYLEDRDSGRDYGMLNYGDYFAGNRTWGNTEYDTGYVAFLQWARSGDLRYFDEACRASIHHRDVDTCHASSDPGRIGGVYRHSIGHVGEYFSYEDRAAPAVTLDDEAFKKRSQSGGVPWGTFTVSHTWIDGFLLHYFLTGDRRSFETAIEVAERYAGEHTRNYEFTNCRNNGWHLILTMEMYRATGDPFYLNASHIIVERTLDRQTEDGAWKRMLAFGHCTCEHPPRHMGNAGFMVGILLVGLKFYHQATGDPRVAESIIRGAGWLVDVLWKGNGFQYTTCPNSGLKSEDMGQMITGLCYAWRISGDEGIRDVLAPATKLLFDGLDRSGRLLSAQGRVAPNILYELAQLDT